MKRKLLTLTVLLAGLFLYNSCTSDDYLRDYEIRQMIEQAIRENNKDLEFTQWSIVNIKVPQDAWEWSDDFAQWEAVADLPELTKFIYEEGAALGYIFLGTQGKDEVQKPLPYVETYFLGDDINGNPEFVTETISCDFQLGNPSTVGFFIKPSDLTKDENAPKSDNFRVVLIW